MNVDDFILSSWTYERAVDIFYENNVRNFFIENEEKEIFCSRLKLFLNETSTTNNSQINSMGICFTCNVDVLNGVDSSHFIHSFIREKTLILLHHCQVNHTQIRLSDNIHRFMTLKATHVKIISGAY